MYYLKIFKNLRGHDPTTQGGSPLPAVLAVLAALAALAKETWEGLCGEGVLEHEDRGKDTKDLLYHLQ